MKKLLLLGALLVVGATSFGAKYQLVGTPNTPQGSTTYAGSGSLQILTEGIIMDAPTDPMLEIITGAASGPGDELHFNFGSMFVGETSTEMADFIARIVKVESGEFKVQQLGNATMTAELKVKDLEGSDVATKDANGFYSFSLYDKADINQATGGTPATEIGTLGYALAFNKYDATSYQGKVTARVDAIAPGEFIDQNSLVEVTVADFVVTP